MSEYRTEMTADVRQRLKIIHIAAHETDIITQLKRAMVLRGTVTKQFLIIADAF